MRQKIRRVIRDLNKLLSRGDKKHNVKEGMKDFVANAIASAEILFTDIVTDEDLIRNGIGTDLQDDETIMINQAIDLMAQIEGLTGYENLKKREKLEQTLNGYLRKLKSVFIRERARINKVACQSS